MSLAYPEPRIQEGEEKEELRAILESGILKRAPNLQHFLEFVAAEYFAGNADQVKEYSIAVHALHRPEQFDPQSSGAYIMWAGTPYAHVHVMGRP